MLVNLESVRFGPERTLLADLFESFNLEDVIKHLVESDEVAPFHQLVLAQQLRLTPVLAPRVFRLFHEVASTLQFTERTDIFVAPSHQINAMALHRLGDDKPHVISISSEMIKSMTDDELRFALGHEIGHLHFRHYRAMLVYCIMARRDEQSEEQGRRQMPRLLERQLDRWQRLSEFSADRVGLVACGGKLSTAVSAFFKMSSGLGPEHLRFDLNSFLDQLRELQQMERKEVFARFSHPATPVRARALQLFAERRPDDPDLTGLDGEVSQLAALMDFEVSTDLGIQARQFLVAGGLLAAHADGEMSEGEQNALVQLLLQVTGDPEGHLTAVQTIDEAERMLAKACTWLSGNSGQERFNLYGQLAHIVALDGHISPQERDVMMRIAEMLSIPAKSARDILHDVLSGYVQTRAATKVAAFGFQSVS